MATPARCHTHTPRLGPDTLRAAPAADAQRAPLAFTAAYARGSTRLGRAGGIRERGQAATGGHARAGSGTRRTDCWYTPGGRQFRRATLVKIPRAAMSPAASAGRTDTE